MARDYFDIGSDSTWVKSISTISAVLNGTALPYLLGCNQKTGLVKEDTAIGLVFPALFSIGVILIAKNANDVHLDIDAVLLGELAFAPFDRLIISGADFGPKSLYRDIWKFD